MTSLWVGGASLAVGEALNRTGRLDVRLMVWTVVALGWVARGQAAPAVLLALVGALTWWGARPRVDPRERLVWARFWETVALLATAGLPVLAAVEAARPPGPMGDAVVALARGVADGDPDAAARFVRAHDTPEARAVAEALTASWVEGLNPEAAEAMAVQILDQWAQDQRLRGHREPVTASMLPGLALVNLLLVFLWPVGSALWTTWIHV